MKGDVRRVAIADRNRIVIDPRHPVARSADAERSGSQRRVDDILVGIPPALRIGQDVTSQDGAGSGIDRERGRASRISSTEVELIARARALGVSGDRVAVVEHQPHHIANHATTQEVSRARLIDLEQHRLLAAKVSHRRRSQHKMKIGLRSAVVVEDLPDTSEVAEIASRAEGRGRRRTISAGRSLVSCSPEIGLDLVDERAHRLRELIAQDVGQLRSIAVRERGLLLARPIE